MKNISFLVNCSKNTRAHLELLLKSLKLNLRNPNHEILVFIDSDNEGIYEYLKNIKHTFIDLKIITHKAGPCVGYARNNNILVELAKYDICSYVQSDMVIDPDYDKYILDELEENTILSATRVEPPLHGYSDKTITKDFGTDPNKFDFEEWNKYSLTIKRNRKVEYFFAPITFHKKTWLDLGGYDTLFRRSREDSDLVQRALQKGVKMIQTWQANVYHFTCISSRGKDWFDKSNKDAQNRVMLQNLADQIELNRFIRKWGSFNHGEKKLTKWDIDLVIKPFIQKDVYRFVSFVNFIEPYVSRVWFDKEEAKNACLISKFEEHYPANELLKFSEEDWDKFKKFYNQIDYDNIFKVGYPEDYSIKIEIDPTKDIVEFITHHQLIHEIFANEGKGTYSMGDVDIHIKELKSVNPNLEVSNPRFDYSLLTIE